MKNSKGKPFPPFFGAGISLFVTRGDGELHQVLLILDQCFDRTLEDSVNSILDAMEEEDGLRPCTPEEMATHAHAMVKAYQEETIAKRLQGRATDPDVQRKFLEGYLGRQGGDA